MSGEAKKLVSQVSSEDLDSWTRASTFSHEVEESVRGHIHEELRSWITFRKLAADCASANVALHGFEQLWENTAKECLQDAHWLERYLINRGGRSNPTPIEPHPVEWPAQPVEPVQPCKEAFNTEKRVLDELQRLENLATTARDAALVDPIQNKLIWKESKHVKDLGDLL